MLVIYQICGYKFVADNDEPTTASLLPDHVLSLPRTKCMPAGSMPSPDRQEADLYPSIGSFRWTQGADRALVDMVRECEFDFEKVAGRLSEIGILADSAVTGRDALIVDMCRVRYTQLDIIEGTACGSDSRSVGDFDSCNEKTCEENKENVDIAKGQYTDHRHKRYDEASPCGELAHVYGRLTGEAGSAHSVEGALVG